MMFSMPDASVVRLVVCTVADDASGLTYKVVLRLEGNLVMGSQSQNPLPGGGLYEALANFQLCSSSFRATDVAHAMSSVTCSNGTVIANTAAASDHLGFVLPVGCCMNTGVFETSLHKCGNASQPVGFPYLGSAYLSTHASCGCQYGDLLSSLTGACAACCSLHVCLKPSSSAPRAQH